MKTEIIFKLSKRWNGRYTIEQGEEITVYAYCDDPTVWPYQVKYHSWKISMFDDPEVHDKKSTPISAQVFEQIKDLISDHVDILLCNEKLFEAYSSTGDTDTLSFSCDSFTKNIRGCSLLYIGREDYNNGKDSDYATVFGLAKEITDLLQEHGIDYLTL